MSYQEERHRMLAKQAEQRKARQLDGRARDILDAAGWNASEEQLRQAAETESWDGGAKAPKVPPEDRDAVIARAIAMQTDPTVRGRRISPEERMATRRGPQTMISREIRQQIVEYARKRRSEGATATPVLLEVCKKFGVQISSGNWSVTYWPKARPSENGAARSKPAVSAKTKAGPSKSGTSKNVTAKPKPITTAADIEPLATPPQKPYAAPELNFLLPEDALVPTPRARIDTDMLRVEDALGGRYRVVLRHECDFLTAMRLVNYIGAAFEASETETSNE